MTSETEVASKILLAQTSKLMRDFREIQLQRSHTDRLKTINSLKEICNKSLMHDLHRLTRHKISDHLTNGMYWIINPLDGDHNFMHGLPLFCASATLFHDDRVLLSLINLPALNNLIRCEPGSGLHSTYGLHKVSSQNNLDNACIVTDCKIDGVNSYALNCNTLSYLYTAYGNTDGFVLSLSESDAKIAALALKEAGGKFSQVGNKFIGSNITLHDELRDKVIQTIEPKNTPLRMISFCCGPTQKSPRWNHNIYQEALIAQSHRSPQGVKRINQTQEMIRNLLGIPKDYKILLLNGSATGAIECAFFNFLGHRPVQNISYDVFGHRWSGELRKIIESYKYITESKIFFNNIEYKNANIYTGDVSEYEKSINKDHDLVFVYTGTSTGFKWTNNNILKRNVSDGLVICDATSAAFAEDLPWNYLDVTCFSFQKALGAEAGLGCLVISPKAYNHFATHKPVFVPPRIIRLDLEVIKDVTEGKLINTISMLNIEEIYNNIQWAMTNGGMSFMQARCKANQQIIINNMPDNLEFLLKNEYHRALCVLCVQPVEPKYRTWDHIRKVAQIAESKYKVYEIGGHPEEVPCWRFWTGPTVQNVEEGFTKFLQAMKSA